VRDGDSLSGSAGRFDAPSEERHAPANGTVAGEIRQEIDRPDRADLLILQYPMWWHLPPAILKGWMDRVFVYGEVCRSAVRFGNGRFVGRTAMLSLAVGTGPATHAHDGRSGGIGPLPWPVDFSHAHVGFDVLAPRVAHGVEAGLRHFDADAVEERPAAIGRRWIERLQGIEGEAALPFNRMADWGDDGRIKPTAPLCTPVIRHRDHLDIG
jgi:NAD(P)H dehydrogenase (quinone)